MFETAAGEGSAGTSAHGPGLKPRAALEVTLQPWQEVQGLVRDVTRDGPSLQVVLEDGEDLVLVRLHGEPRGPRLETGARLAILRTEEPPGYVARPLD